VVSQNPNKSLEPTPLTALRAIKGTRAVRAAAQLHRSLPIEEVRV